uniref:Alpha-1,6-mannosyl-glycoprotein 6-beta-N-acetylglucosaminyltransferase n=1 Tax=Heterorhabditis bacteriophora TaxID=37862 RepID=A0A1I7W8T2_HETBA
MSVEENKHYPTYDPLRRNFSTVPLLEVNDLSTIQQTFVENMRSAGEIYSRLPEFSLYYPLIEQCYNNIFYNGENHSKCKGPELCDLPQFPGVRCTNVKSQYETFPDYNNIFLHRLVDVRFVESYLGCSM